MSLVKPSELQVVKRMVFADAVAYTKSISRNRVKKAEYQQKVRAGECISICTEEILAQQKK